MKYITICLLLVFMFLSARPALAVNSGKSVSYFFNDNQFHPCEATCRGITVQGVAYFDTDYQRNSCFIDLAPTCDFKGSESYDYLGWHEISYTRQPWGTRNIYLSQDGFPDPELLVHEVPEFGIITASMTGLVSLGGVFDA